MSLSVELVSSDQLPYVCLGCKRTYKHIPAGYQVPVGAYSSGYCPDCLPLKEGEWFGGKVTA